jgi:hypothetical protein
MDTYDTFSTLVESHHLHDEIANLEQATQKWINTGGQLTGESQFNALYQKIIGPDAQTLNQAEVIQKLTNFKKYLASIPVLEITMAFEADQLFKEQLIKKIAPDIKGPFVVKFNTDQDIIAGCKVSFKGKFGDYSVLKIMTDSPGKVFDDSLGITHD